MFYNLHWLSTSLKILYIEFLAEQRDNTTVTAKFTAMQTKKFVVNAGLPHIFKIIIHTSSTPFQN